MAGSVRLDGVRQGFAGFDRAPYLASFRLKGTRLSVQLVNVHLFYGSPARGDIERRALETVAVARWCGLRRRSRFLRPSGGGPGALQRRKPARDGGNIVYDALTRAGLVTPPHSSHVGSSIASDNHYDQIAFFPETTRDWLVEIGVFDYDGVVFPGLWRRGRAAFNGFLRYYLSDHRPMWMRVRLA